MTDHYLQSQVAINNMLAENFLVISSVAIEYNNNYLDLYNNFDFTALSYNMIYSAEVVRLSNDIEEEVELCINGVNITCFVSVCPFQIHEHAIYKVALTPLIFDDYFICEVPNEKLPSLVKVKTDYSYAVVGELIGNRLDAGCIVLEDDTLLSDYGYLDGKMVLWKVDRIDVEFISD